MLVSRRIGVVIPILWIKLKIWENKHCVLPIMRAMGWSCSSDIQWWRPTVVDARGAPKATTVWEKPIKVKLALIITLICYSYTCLTWLWNRGRLLIWSLILNKNFSNWRWSSSVIEYKSVNLQYGLLGCWDNRPAIWWSNISIIFAKFMSQLFSLFLLFYISL